MCRGLPGVDLVCVQVIDKKVALMKNPRRRRRFDGWPSSVQSLQKVLPRVHASTVSQAHFLTHDDLGGKMQ